MVVIPLVVDGDKMTCKPCSSMQEREYFESGFYINNSDRRIMCSICRHHDKKIKICTKTNLTINKTLVSPKPRCPLGKHDKDIKWMFLRWKGIPYPIRVYLYLFNKFHRKPKNFQRCGCISKLKDFTTKCKNRIYNLGRLLVNKRA